MLFSLCLFSQKNQGITPSPTVAWLVTVEKDSLNNTGTIVQTLPITELKLGTYSFHINLIYSSQGVKVEEILHYAGIRWNLYAYLFNCVYFKNNILFTKLKLDII